MGMAGTGSAAGWAGAAGAAGMMVASITASSANSGNVEMLTHHREGLAVVAEGHMGLLLEPGHLTQMLTDATKSCITSHTNPIADAIQRRNQVEKLTTEVCALPLFVVRSFLFFLLVGNVAFLFGWLLVFLELLGLFFNDTLTASIFCKMSSLNH